MVSVRPSRLVPTNLTFDQSAPFGRIYLSRTASLTVNSSTRSDRRPDRLRTILPCITAKVTTITTQTSVVISLFSNIFLIIILFFTHFCAMNLFKVGWFNDITINNLRLWKLFIIGIIRPLLPHLTLSLLHYQFSGAKRNNIAKYISYFAFPFTSLFYCQITSLLSYLIHSSSKKRLNQIRKEISKDK